MRKSISPKSGITLPPDPVIRTIITPSESKKWKGCIYISSYDLTGQILLLLDSLSGTRPPELAKIPIYKFTASSREELDAQMSEAIKFIFKNKRSSSMPKSA
jgi:hypothetical protein